MAFHAQTMLMPGKTASHAAFSPSRMAMSLCNAWAFLDEMYEVDVVRDIISMDVESDDDDE